MNKGSYRIFYPGNPPESLFGAVHRDVTVTTPPTKVRKIEIIERLDSLGDHDHDFQFNVVYKDHIPTSDYFSD